MNKQNRQDGWPRRLWLAAALVLLATLTQAAAAPATAGARDMLAHGAADGAAPAWQIDVVTPPGWTRDCCDHAGQIGVDALLYRGKWTGKPERVMVLNVWPRVLPTLQAELDADRRHYLARDPGAKATSFPIPHSTMPCKATVYQGTDHIDDVVVFCDPGKASGVRLSWSTSFRDDDPQRRALLDDFMDVVALTHYRRYAAAPGDTAHR